MPRPRLYPSHAARQQAYRERQRSAVVKPTPVKKPRKPKPLSRQARLDRVEEEVSALVEEFQAWRDAMPENLTGSELAGQLDDAIALLEQVVDQITAIDLPRGFGR